MVISTWVFHVSGMGGRRWRVDPMSEPAWRIAAAQYRAACPEAHERGGSGPVRLMVKPGTFALWAWSRIF
jgi:hypothetical protein